MTIQCYTVWVIVPPMSTRSLAWGEYDRAWGSMGWIIINGETSPFGYRLRTVCSFAGRFTAPRSEAGKSYSRKDGYLLYSVRLTASKVNSWESTHGDQAIDSTLGGRGGERAPSRHDKWPLPWVFGRSPRVKVKGTSSSSGATLVDPCWCC